MEEKITLGRFVAKKRKEKKLTQRELAEKLYVTESAVSKWERGISYPDITLVAGICEVLDITEHELITASEDFYQRKTQQQAKSYERFISFYKWIGIAAYGIALVTCFICNIAVQHTLSWFFIVLTAEMTGFSLTTLPALLTKNRAILTLCGFFISLNLLLMTCAIYSGGDWFLITFISVLFGLSVVFMPLVLRAVPLPSRLVEHKTMTSLSIDSILLFALLFVCLLQADALPAFFTDAVPSAVYCLIYPWTIMAIIRYTRINGLFKTSACILITGLFSYFSLGVFRVIADSEPFWSLYAINLNEWSQGYLSGNILLITLLSCIAMAAAFAIGGIILSVKRSRVLM